MITIYDLEGNTIELVITNRGQVSKILLEVSSYSQFHPVVYILI